MPLAVVGGIANRTSDIYAKMQRKSSEKRIYIYMATPRNHKRRTAVQGPLLLTERTVCTLQDLADAHRKTSGLALSTIGMYAVKDARFFRKICASGKLTTIKYDQMMNWLSANWPVGLAWPRQYEAVRPGRPMPGTKSAAPKPLLRRPGQLPKIAPSDMAEQAVSSRDLEIAVYRRDHDVAATAERFGLSVRSIWRVMTRVNQEVKHHGKTTQKPQRKRTAAATRAPTSRAALHKSGGNSRAAAE